MVNGNAIMKKRRLVFLMGGLLVLSMLIVLTSCKPSLQLKSDQAVLNTIVFDDADGPARTDAMLDLEKIEIPDAGLMRMSKQLRQGVLITIDADGKAIFSYDVANGSTEVIVLAKEERFIDSIACNSEWIVWVEDESFLYDTSNKTYQWTMYAKNVLNGDEFAVDQSKFKTNQYNVPQCNEFVPCQLMISDQNVLVYCRTTPNGPTVSSEIIAYDLQTKKLEIIDQARDVNTELIAYCSIDNQKIVWSRFCEFNETVGIRDTRYLYSDLYIYDLQSDLTEQITSGDFYNEGYIFEDKMVAIHIPESIPEQNSLNSEVVLIDLKSMEVRTIVEASSPCYENCEYAIELYRSMPKINENYISWYNGGFDNQFLYDYHNDIFLEIDKFTNEPNHLNTRVWNMFGDACLMSHYSNDREQILYYVLLND